MAQSPAQTDRDLASIHEARTLARRAREAATLLAELTQERIDAIVDAMRQGEIRPEDVDYINAHGSGTKQNDRHETAAFKRSLGDHAYKVPISSIKSMVGHSLGGIGAIEMACCALVIKHGIIPPTINLDEPDPECDLDYVPNVAREAKVRVALNNSFGFGGHNATLIAKEYVG